MYAFKPRTHSFYLTNGLFFLCILVCAGAAFFVFVSCLNPSRPQERIPRLKADSSEGQDVAFYAEQVSARHKDAFANIDSASFSAACSEAIARLDSADPALSGEKKKILYFKMDAGHPGGSLVPDVIVEPTLSDIRSGIDTQLEYCLAH